MPVSSSAILPSFATFTVNFCAPSVSVEGVTVTPSVPTTFVKFLITVLPAPVILSNAVFALPVIPVV